MLALIVKVLTMQRLRKIRSFFPRIPNILQITVHFRMHISAGHVCEQTLQ